MRLIRLVIACYRLRFERCRLSRHAGRMVL
jgi:hypothetical protein